nr:trigger factor [Pseudomonadota bacterium]
DFDENNHSGPFTYSATFEVYPEIALAPLTGFSIEKLNTEIKEADVDTMLDRMRGQHADWSEVDRPAAKGDKIIIDFVGSVDGVEFEGGTAEDFELELGGNSMIPGFEDGLIGAKKGDHIKLKVKFPDDYHATELSGKEAEFATTVKSVLGSILPELNDELAAKFGIKEGGIPALRADITKNMNKEILKIQRDRLKTALMDKLVESNQFEIPAGLVNDEIKRIKEDLIQRFARGNPDLMNNLPTSQFEEQAKKNVKVGLIFSHLVESQDIKPSNEKVMEKLAEFAESYDNPQQMMDLYKKNDEALDYFRSSALEDTVIEKLLADVQIKEKTVPYDEFMKPEQKED